jgi:hypothetical protein
VSAATASRPTIEARFIAWPMSRFTPTHEAEFVQSPWFPFALGHRHASRISTTEDPAENWLGVLGRAETAVRPELVGRIPETLFQCIAGRIFSWGGNPLHAGFSYPNPQTLVNLKLAIAV